MAKTCNLSKAWGEPSAETVAHWDDWRKTHAPQTEIKIHRKYTDNRPILPNWGVQSAWLESIGFWDAWLALPVDYERREHIPEGEQDCLEDDERVKLEAFRSLQKRMETMERPWDKELGIVRPIS